MMKRRRRMSPREIKHEDWIIWSAAAVLAVIIALALIGYFSGRWDTPPV